jgi:hypothetical protein
MAKVRALRPGSRGWRSRYSGALPTRRPAGVPPTSVVGHRTRSASQVARGPFAALRRPAPRVCQLGTETRSSTFGAPRALRQVMKEELAFLKYRREVVRAWPESPRKTVFLTAIESRISSSIQQQLQMVSFAVLHPAPAG